MRESAPRGLAAIAGRAIPPPPWQDGDNLPWEDPTFSERVLVEHLSQEHDRASRRQTVIDAQLRFIAARVRPRSGRILDLACGPGLYLHGLAALGHHGRGLDFAPAAIRHARTVAEANVLDCQFEEADLRTADFGEDYDVVLLLFGQLNVFPRPIASDLLARAAAALAPGGTLILEPQLAESVRDTGEGIPTWETLDAGLFSPRPHLLLHEPFWDEASRTATERWHVIELGAGTVDRHAMSTCAWETDELITALREADLEQVEVHSSLASDEDAIATGLFGLTATRAGLP